MASTGITKKGMKREGDTVMVKECIRRDECATRSTGSEGENDGKDLRKDWSTRRSMGARAMAMVTVGPLGLVLGLLKHGFPHGT